MRFAKPRQTQPKLRVEHKHKNLALQNFLSLEIDKCIRHSIDGPLMPYAIRIIPGMSGQRFRKLLNGLAQIPISGSYLEIGTFKGSTACSALYKSQRSAILIDNWSEFGGPKKIAQENLNRFCSGSAILFMDLEFSEFYRAPVNQKIFLYFYDGGHSFEEQRLAVDLINSLNFDNLIFVVDDFSWETVQKATSEGLRFLNSVVVKTWTILPSENDELFRYGEWHNGYFICLISKKE